YESGKSLAEQEKQQEFLQRETVELDRRQLTLARDIEQLTLKLTVTEEELNQGRSELEELLAANQGAHHNLDQLQSARQVSENKLNETRSRLSHLQGELSSQLACLTGLRNLMESLHVADSKQSAEQDLWQKERENKTIELVEFTKKSHEYEQNKRSLESQII